MRLVYGRTGAAIDNRASALRQESRPAWLKSGVVWTVKQHSILQRRFSTDIVHLHDLRPNQPSEALLPALVEALDRPEEIVGRLQAGMVARVSAAHVLDCRAWQSVARFEFGVGLGERLAQGLGCAVWRRAGRTRRVAPP